MDKIDRKILYELDKNSRQPITILAKKVRLNRNTAEYRLNQLVEKGVIKQFVTLFNPLVFNNQLYKIYLQLQNIDDKKEKEILQYLQSLPLYWLAKCYGRWDYMVGIRADSPTEFNKIKLDILSRLEEHIVNKNITLMVNAPFFDRDYLVENETHYRMRHFVTGLSATLDETDKNILRLLSTDSRMSSMEISAKVKLSLKTTIQRIRRLEKEKVIVGYKISLDLEKTGYLFMKAFISLKNISEKDHKRFISYCMSVPNLIHLVECLGEWDFEPEFEVANEQQFYVILKDMRNEFSKIIKTIDVVTIVKEYEYKAY